MGEEEDGRLRLLEAQLMLAKLSEAVALLKQRMDFRDAEAERRFLSLEKKIDLVSDGTRGNASKLWSAAAAAIGLLLLAVGYLLDGRI